MGDTQLQIVISAKNDLEKGIAAANAQLSQLGQNVTNANSKAQSLSVGTIAMGAALGGFFQQAAHSVFNFGKSMITAAGQYEQTRIAFEVMLGSAEKANTLLRDLSDFAMKTPFTLVGVEESARMLTAYGFQANEMVNTLTMLGDVSAGISKPLSDVAYVYGTLKAQGQAYMMDIRQFAMRGIPIYEELAKVMKTNVSSVKDFVSEGKVGFKEVEAAFKSMTGEGGRYHDLMVRQSQTLLGRISNVDDAWTRFLRTQGNGLISFANIAVDALYKVLDWLNKDAQGANLFGKTIYGLIQFFVALGKTVWSVAKIIAEFIAIGIEGFVGLSKQTIAYAKDFVNAFKNIKDIGLSVFEAFGKAMTGDFTGAANTIKQTFATTFSNSISASAESKNIIGAHLSAIGGEMKNIGSAWSDFIGLKGFESASMKFGSLGESSKSLDDGLKEDSKSAKKLEEAISKMTEKLSDVKTKGLDSLNSLGEKIVDITKQLNDLYADKSKQQSDINMSYGEEYVKQEEKVAQIQKEMKEKEKEYAKARFDKSDDVAAMNEKLNTLRNELDEKEKEYNKENSVLQKYSYIAIQYANQVKDARIIANNTEFENALENLRKKQDQLDIEFYGKKATLEAELKAEVDKYNQVAGFVKQAFNEEKAFNNLKVKATAETVNKQIEYYNKLAEAISRATQGKTSSGVTATQVNKSLELSQTGYKVAPINVTINASNIVGQNAGKELGNLIMNTLKDNAKL